MRLRQILLTFGALAAAWIGLTSHHGSRHTVSARPAPEPPHASDAHAGEPRAREAHAQLTARKKRTVRRPARPHRVARVPAPARRSGVSVAKKRVRRTNATTVVEGERIAAEEPRPSEPPTIVDAQVGSVTSSTARITWRTNVPTRGQAAFGLDAPTIWVKPDNETAIDHESFLAGLDASMTYQVYLRAFGDEGRVATAGLTLSTGPRPETSTARTDGDRIIVDDSPVFARAVWKQCSDGFSSNIDDGINLFIGDGCSRTDRGLPDRLDGRAYSLVSADDADAPGRGVIGWYYPDEWDAFLESTVERRDLADAIVAPPAGRIGFLTLTNHFYSRAEALPQGKGMYPPLFTIPDVIGFDLYPLQGWCRPSFGDVFDAQRELSSASGGKPTFQWIEVAPMEQVCGRIAALDPTPATVRAETWLAIAGGADTVGYFPNRWSPLISAEIQRTNREIKALTPALLAAPVDASPDDAAVRVSGRSLNGALYVIAVNTAEETVQTRISVEGIAGRSAMIFGAGAGPAKAADGRGLVDSLGPLAVRVYLFPPHGW
jgi:hypothetical protein